MERVHNFLKSGTHGSGVFMSVKSFFLAMRSPDWVLPKNSMPIIQLDIHPGACHLPPAKVAVFRKALSTITFIISRSRELLLEPVALTVVTKICF